jgi:predicted GNAT family acetyltransferase
MRPPKEADPAIRAVRNQLKQTIVSHPKACGRGVKLSVGVNPLPIETAYPFRRRNSSHRKNQVNKVTHLSVIGRDADLDSPHPYLDVENNSILVERPGIPAMEEGAGIARRTRALEQVLPQRTRDHEQVLPFLVFQFKLFLVGQERMSSGSAAFIDHPCWLVVRYIHDALTPHLIN